MVKSDDPERQIWGTWEELLLACAVGRHGTRRWESVATEIRSRIPFPHLVTPQSCRQRYGDLQRRFSGAGAGDDDGEDADSPSEVPWLEELRKLRVAELRLEVERYDLSIGSLQLKVKKLEEERERSIRESRSGDEKPDRPAEESRPSESTPETVAGERISDKVSGPSCGESTSTSPKKNERKPGKEGRKPAEEENGGGKLTVPTDDDDGGEKVSPASRERSCDGSTEGDASSDPASRPQSGESVAESSKREAEGEEQVKEEDEEVGRESSDVQSSASLSRRRQQGRGRGWRKAVVSGGSSSVGDEAEGDAEAEEVSGVNNGQGVVESRPLVAFLEIIRSDKHGSVFDCRLDSQESEEYRRLIRQHVDLEMVQSRIDRIGSGHPYAATEFFRDLLLLCNNALVFYPKDAPECVAAQRLRELVSKRMGGVLRVPSLFKGEAVPALTLGPKPTDTKPKLELDVPFSLLSKTAASTPLIIACRKRSAISNKAAAATSLKEEEVEEEEEIPEPDKKSKDNEDKWQGKRTTKEKPVLSGTTRGLRTSKTRSGHGGGGGAAGKKSGVAPATNFKSKTIDSAVSTEAPSKTDKKTVGGGATPPAAPSTKKQSAASFLNRMKNSNGSATKAAETAKSSPAGGSGKGSNPKKGGKSANQKYRSSRQGIAAVGGGGSTKKSEETSGGKRSVGRPPKRSAPPPTPPPSKRAREETEPTAPSRPPTSASRKRGGRR